MKKYFSLILIFTMILTLPLSVMAEATPLNLEIDISEKVNYDLVINKRGDLYTGVPLMYMYDNATVSSPETIGDFSYNLISNNYGENDSIYISGNDSVKISGITPLAADGETGYIPKSKKLGIIAGTMSDNATVKVTITYENEGTDSSSVTVSPITVKGSYSSSAKTSVVKDIEAGGYFNVKNGADIYFNSYEIELNSLAVTDITFEAVDNPYHVSAVSLLYYSEEEWASNIGKGVNNLYKKFADKTPNDSDLKLSELQSLISLLDATKNDIISGNDIGIDDDIVADLNSNGVENEIERFQMLLDCINLVDKKQSIKDDMDNLSCDSYVNASDDAYKSYTDVDLENIDALISKYNDAAAVDSQLEAVLAYWNDKSIEVSVVNVNTDDVLKLEAQKSAYISYKTEIQFKADLDKIDELADKELLDVTVAEFKDIKAFFENENFFNSDLESSFVKNENKETIEKLKNIYLNYEKVKNSEAPYLVDLSDYFGADIFYDSGDTASDIGMIPKSTQYAFPRSVLTSSAYIKDGIISVSASNVQQSYAYDTTGAFKVVDKDFRAYLGDVPLSFDVSKALKNGNSAVMLPNNTSKDDNCVQTISGVFSSKSSKYLSLLVASPHDKYWFEAIVNFADGTSKQYFINTTNTSYAGRVKTFAGLETTEKKYTTGSGWQDGANNIKITTFALELDTETGKIIKSVDIYRNDSNRQDNHDVWVTTGFSPMANVPVLAMTEIPIKNNEFINNIALPAWDAVKNFSEADYTADNSAKIQNITQAYNEAMARGLNADEIFVYEDGTSGAEKVKEMSNLVLTAKSVTDRTKVNEIKSKINFSIPATGIKENITVAKDGNILEAGVDYKLTAADDGLSAEILIPVTKNGGVTYTFTVSGNVAVKKNPSMTMGIDYVYTYKVPDYVTYSYGEKVVNNSDVPVDVTVAVVALGDDGKTVYSADSDFASDVTKGKPSAVDVAFDSSALLDKEYSSVSYVFDDQFKMISNDSNVPVVTAEADSNANYKIPELDLINNALTLKGFTPSKESNKVVNLKVYNSTHGKDVYYGSVKTNENGYFVFEIVLPTDVYKNSFNMKFTVGGDDFSSPDASIADIYFSTAAEREAIVDYIMNADDKKDLTDGENLNGTKVTIERIKRELALEFEPLSVVTEDAFAEAAINLFGELESTPSVNDAQKILKQAAVLAAYRENKQDYLYKNGDFLYEDVMKYSDINKNGVTLYNIFKNSVYITGKDKIVEEISGTEYKNLNELYSALKKSIFVEALNYPSQFGTSYVGVVLTAENALAVGADISKYTNSTNKSAYEKAIAENSGKFTNVDSVANFIGNYKVPVSEDKTDNSPVNSYPSTKFSASGFDTQDDSYVFSDVSQSYWAYGNIISLYNKGIVSGKGNKIFDPEGYVTRGEVVKMICVAYNLVNKAETPFTDLGGKWYSDYAAICYANNLINGVNEAYFGGDEKITRQDLCTILYRLKNGEEAFEINFADKNEIADYAKGAVAFMNKNGIVNGFSDNTFKPNDYCTRAQMSKIFDLFLGL